ncbi:MAG: RNA-directed DNA polymerase, partial [Phenylobacterium sp.]|nr:RNA-directed DNA polymerase [Phenylobacterium sp.]
MLKELIIQPFFQHRIPKRNRTRGHRIAWEPSLCKAEYKALGRRLGGFFEHKLAPYPHPSVFGYLGGRNIKDNAAVHKGHRRLVAVDIASFFPSISAVRIKQLFLELGMSEEVALSLSRFVTIGGTLPLGLPT